MNAQQAINTPIAERIARATAEWNPKVESRYYGVIANGNGYQLVDVRVDKTKKASISQRPIGRTYATQKAAELAMIQKNGDLFRAQGF